MFSSLLWFISLLLYDLSNLSNIYSAGPSVCLVNSVICCLCCLIQFAFIFLSLTHTHICSCRQLPHAPENPISVLSMTEKRAINLTWAPAFDGNSPLIRYILEVSENSECFSLQHFLSTNVSVSRALMGETEIYILLVWKQLIYYVQHVLKFSASSSFSFLQSARLNCLSILTNDQANQIVLTANALIIHSHDKIKEIWTLILTKNESLDHLSAELMLTETMTAH